jgi:5-methylcytosine-specific restriction protein A
MPTRPAAPCAVLHCPNRQPCPLHPRRRPTGNDPTWNVNPTRGTTAKRGYGEAHRQRRQQVLALYPRCVYEYPGCTQVSTVCDHVIALRDGGADALENLVGCCRHCHAVKSQRESRES